MSATTIALLSMLGVSLATLVGLVVHLVSDIGRRLERLDDNLSARMDGLSARMDGFSARMDGFAAELRAMRAR